MSVLVKVMIFLIKSMIFVMKMMLDLAGLNDDNNVENNVSHGKYYESNLFSLTLSAVLF